ncbi:hypothetical protein MKW92_018670 [Papaver armeniacum]|nr:hypothetical protein MKW92_018670 [Papaver armeniacum]
MCFWSYTDGFVQGSAILGNDGTVLLHENDFIGGAQPEPAGWFISSLLTTSLTKFHIGMLCLIGNCFCLSLHVFSFFIAPLLLKYPASLSVAACSYFFGAMFMVIAGIFATDENIVWTLMRSELVVVLYAVSTSH